MLVKFTTNVGSNDANPLGLDFKKCTEGALLEVRDETAERLLRRKFAVQVENVKGVSAKPAIADAKPAEIQATEETPKPKRATTNKEN
jgi:hypothetical protein